MPRVNDIALLLFIFWNCSTVLILLLSVIFLFLSSSSLDSCLQLMEVIIYVWSSFGFLCRMGIASYFCQEFFDS